MNWLKKIDNTVQAAIDAIHAIFWLLLVVGLGLAITVTQWGVIAAVVLKFLGLEHLFPDFLADK